MNQQRRYANGNTPEQQSRADAQYRARQRRLRTWADDLANTVGLSREQLLNVGNAELVSLLLQHHYREDPPTA